MNINRFFRSLTISVAAFVMARAPIAMASDAGVLSEDVKICHVWEKVEIVLHSKTKWVNPYTEATVWVDLKGPNFAKRCYGFWDGGDTFRVRVTATGPGSWTWRSGSEPADSGLDGASGAFTASEWTEAQKAEVHPAAA